MPVVGYLSGGSPDERAGQLAAFHQGLREGGYFEGQNVHLEYRWAEGRPDRLSALAADLVSRRVNVIFATAGMAVRDCRQVRNPDHTDCLHWRCRPRRSWVSLPVSTGRAATSPAFQI